MDQKHGYQKRNTQDADHGLLQERRAIGVTGGGGCSCHDVVVDGLGAIDAVYAAESMDVSATEVLLSLLSLLSLLPLLPLLSLSSLLSPVYKWEESSNDKNVMIREGYPWGGVTQCK